MSKKVIAIIGATGRLGSAFSKRLAKSNYRLLLFDYNLDTLTSLVQEIKNINEMADIDFMTCATEASWEADIIIPDSIDEKDIVEKIEPVTNRKIVLSISSSNTANELHQLLPGAKIVRITDASGSKALDWIQGDKKTKVFIDSADDEALETSIEVIKAAGFDPVVSNINNNNFIIHSIKN